MDKVDVGQWVIRPNGKAAIVREVRHIYGVWVFKGEVLGTLVDVEWVNKRGVLRHATHDIENLQEVPA